VFPWKLALLTCLFYIVATALFELVLWILVQFRGVMIFIMGPHWFWSVGLLFGIVLGTLWLISFGAAWYIVARGIRSVLPGLP